MRVREYKYLNELPGPADAVMATGAITDPGRPDEYAIAREALRYDARSLA
ncbi:hypothetical protein [Streptomyces sp. AC495_CC817]|nr:hypothetical protein [Streptomyces sp. AC495_CC817]